jgi:aminoglycoside phosphotransferase (APT) family kinase protein
VPELEEHPTLLRSLEQLAALDLPPTLGHGDLHLGNVAIAGDGHAIVYDWSDACVCHPLFDLAFFLFQFRDERVRDDLVAAWAEGWEVPADEIRAALRLADPLTYIHQRISYREIGASIEPDDRSLFAGEPERWLEEALRRASA